MIGNGKVTLYQYIRPLPRSGIGKGQRMRISSGPTESFGNRKSR